MQTRQSHRCLHYISIDVDEESLDENKNLYRRWIRGHDRCACAISTKVRNESIKSNTTPDPGHHMGK